MSWRKGPERPNYRRWRIVRVKVLDRDGWACVKCGHKGRLEVDHIKRLEDGGAVYDETNLQTLCRDCHFEKSQEERRGKPTPPEVLEWQRYLTKSLMKPTIWCMI